MFGLLIIGISLFGLYILVGLVYYFFQESMIFVRYNLHGKYHFKLKRKYREVLLQSPDGHSLHGLWIKAKKPRGVIVYFHGNTGSLKRWGKIAAEITRFGYDVLAPDYRGYGKSTGKPSEKKLIEDSRLFYEEAKNTYAAEQIVFFGRSLGSGVAVQLAAQVKPQKLILETPFYSLLDVVQSRFKIFPFKWLLRHPFYSNIHIQRVQSPILILHGKKDSIVPFSSAKKLFGLVKDRHNVSFQVFKYGGHNDLSTFPKYTKAIAEFLDG